MLAPRETYKLRTWIDPTKLQWQYLSGNTHSHAIQMLKEHPENIDWWYLSSNPYAMHLLETEPERINWGQMSHNPRALHLVEQNPDKFNYWKYVSRWSYNNQMRGIIEEHLDSVAELVEMVTAINEQRMQIQQIPMFVPSDNLDWSALSCGSRAMHLLERHPEKIDWQHLSSNSHPKALRLLEKHPEKIDWQNLSRNTNPDAIRMLEQHPEKIDWWYLSSNSAAKRLLEQYPEKIIWSYLCNNRSEWAMGWLETHPEKINWIYLSGNPLIFTFNDTYDYEDMKESKRLLHQDLIQTMFHPNNLAKMNGWGFENAFEEE